MFSVYRGAQGFLLGAMTVCFVGTLLTSGAIWMIGSDRIQAGSALGRRLPRLLRHVQPAASARRSAQHLSGMVSALCMVAAIGLFDSGANATLVVVLASRHLDHTNP